MSFHAVSIGKWNARFTLCDYVTGSCLIVMFSFLQLLVKKSQSYVVDIDPCVWIKQSQDKSFVSSKKQTRKNCCLCWKLFSHDESICASTEDLLCLNAELPLEPSLSRTLIEANDYGCLSHALTVAAMLSAETSLLPGRRQSSVTFLKDHQYLSP